MDTPTPSESPAPPAIAPNKKQTHKERRVRRQEIAKFIANLFETKPETSARVLMGEAAKHFGVSIGTVETSCVEFGVMRQNKPKQKQEGKVGSIKKLLQTTDRTCTSIARELRVSKQRVHQVYAQMIEDGEQIPLRTIGIWGSKRSLDRENKLISRYKETKSIYEARIFAGFTRKRAMILLREAGLAGDKYVKPDGGPRSTKTMLILGALFDDSLTFSDIARRFNVPPPRIFNVAQSALHCGVPLPVRHSGTVSSFGSYLSALLIRKMAKSDKPIILDEFKESVQVSLRSLPPSVEIDHWRLSNIIKAQINRFIRDKLVTSAHCRHLRAVSFALTEKGRHDANLLTDQVMSDIRQKLIAQFSSPSPEPSSSSGSSSESLPTISNHLNSG